MTAESGGRRPHSNAELEAVRSTLERKAFVLNLVGLLALALIVIITGTIATSPGLGDRRIALLALTIAMVAFLVPTAEAQRRNAMEAADALDLLSGESSDAEWLRVQRRIPRFFPRLWPRDESDQETRKTTEQ